MATTYNGKQVLVDLQRLFKGAHTVAEAGSFPLSIRVGNAGTGQPFMAWDAVRNVFEFVIEGVNSSRFDVISAGGGAHRGAQFEWLAHTTLVGNLAGDDVYQVHFVAYEV